MSISETKANDVLAALDRDGYVVLERVVADANVAAVRSAVDELLEIDRRDLTKKHGGTLHLDVIDAGAVFDQAWSSPRVLTAVAHVLGANAAVFAAGFRGPRPGYGAQALHADDVPICAGEPYRDGDRAAG